MICLTSARYSEAIFLVDARLAIIRFGGLDLGNVIGEEFLQLLFELVPVEEEK